MFSMLFRAMSSIAIYPEMRHQYIADGPTLRISSIASPCRIALHFCKDTDVLTRQCEKELHRQHVRFHHRPLPPSPSCRESPDSQEYQGRNANCDH